MCNRSREPSAQTRSNLCNLRNLWIKFLTAGQSLRDRSVIEARGAAAARLMVRLAADRRGREDHGVAANRHAAADVTLRALPGPDLERGLLVGGCDLRDRGGRHVAVAGHIRRRGKSGVGRLLELGIHRAGGADTADLDQKSGPAKLLHVDSAGV